jgi:DNA polymerase III subunit epsilon
MGIKQAMREIVLDTETTGFDYRGDDRIVEIGCVEMVNHMATDKTFQCYINPERDMPEGAFSVHGLSEEFLSDFPVFSETVDDFLDFIGDDPLIIHNADFDMGFINAELERLGRKPLSMDRTKDTVQIARSKFPGARVNLDELCRRFQIDLSDRALHGALKDANLLARVYLELVGGRQPGLELASVEETTLSKVNGTASRAARAHKQSAEEEQRHNAFLDKIEDPVWRA